MKINALLNGRQVNIVDIQRSGSQVTVAYIDGTGNGALVSTVFYSSAAADPNIIISTSAFWLA